MDPIAISLFLLLFLLFLGEILLLLTPIDFSLDIERFERMTRSISKVSFGFLEVRVDSPDGTANGMILFSGRPVYRFPVQDTDLEEEKEREPHIEMKRTDSGIRYFRPVMRHGRELFSDFMKVSGDILHAISIRTLEIDIRLGLSSPALTGVVFGYFSAFRALLSPVRRMHLSMTPVFSEEVLEGRVLLLLRVPYPVRIIASVFRLLLGKNMRRLLLDLKGEVHHE
ncbi:MAG TPA: DUF2953 domain-containing protein [Methanoregulaceae archaeon]|jgi:hypothetical protein|nr:DUF2953 domain-containing protein [Methanoregulaceae archaeon]MDD5048841.1 DUF2953 domain-containing protein [Methanoregulaceae archaeon]MDD5685197.1 DUF2953 domain-containing protein [Methanoregulaceae archaeon]HOP66125.1 DUF2953 domain-containing protein [Methanoregulaceae archaeon]HQC12917.1 DUF2953 domain-containing protein [Methanoregulaceae archaeon]